MDISAEHLDIPDGPFDLIWGADVLWAENVGDPVAAVARLVEHLVPGGTLALFWSNYYESTFLPGRPAAARAARAASEHRWELQNSGPHHHDRHLAWLQQNALDDYDPSAPYLHLLIGEMGRRCRAPLRDEPAIMDAGAAVPLGALLFPGSRPAHAQPRHPHHPDSVGAWPGFPDTIVC